MNPKSLLQLGRLCLSHKWLTIVFYGCNADTTPPIAMKKLCYLKGSLISFNWVLSVRKEPRATLRLHIQPSWVIDHSTCCKLIRAGQKVAEWKIIFKWLPACEENSVVYPLYPVPNYSLSNDICKGNLLSSIFDTVV